MITRHLNCIFSLLVFASFYSTAAAAGRMKAAKFEPGGPEKLGLGDVAMPTLRAGQVLIKVHATAINRADTLQRKGLYPSPPGESEILGLEAAGIVEQLGPDCGSRWKPGDRVMALLGGGGNAEYVAAWEGLLLPVPVEMDFVTAAAIPEVWLTAFQLLHTVAHLQSGETVLIHAGASGVGTAAVQLTRLVGAVPIVTAGSAEKLALAKSLGAEHGFKYKEEDFGARVLEVTQGKGVDIILDCVGASHYEKNAACIAMDGRWVVYGLMGGSNISGDVLAKLLRKRISLIGSTLRARPLPYKEALVRDFTERALPHFANMTLRTIVDTVLPLSDISAAHALMESNQNAGKIILTVVPDKEKKKEDL